MATDFIIDFFGGGPLLTRAIARLKNPVFHWTPSRPPIPEGRETADWSSFVQKYNSSILNMWKSVGPTGETLGRIAVIGFSEGCQGVREVLKCKDASKIDVLIPVDGIHADLLGKGAGGVRLVDPELLKYYIGFARMAANLSANKVMVVTHSSIKPTKFASTTETAEIIWNAATEPPPDVISVTPEFQIKALSQVVWPNADLPVGTKIAGSTITQNGYCTTRPKSKETNNLPQETFCWQSFADGWTARRAMNGLNVFGWSYPTKSITRDPTGNRDHVFQAQMVLPTIVQKYLVERWNPLCSIEGFSGTSSCAPGGGEGYFQGETPSPIDVSNTPSVPRPVLPCAQPSPGNVITGTPGNACSITPEQPPGPPSPTPSPAESSSMGTNILAGLVGAGLGYAMYYYASKFWGTRRR
jgi:hypothetical protein